jgi:cytochrome c oxidase assembly protein subunit 11
LTDAVVSPRRFGRPMSSGSRARDARNNNLLMFAMSGGCIAFGGGFLLVPMYQRYCQSKGTGAASHKEYAAPPKDKELSKRLFTIDFKSHVDTSCPWSFEPEQTQLKVGVGETALAFYRARNLSDKPTIGQSVYHMIPPDAGLYFNKIQCFCFEEQLLNPGEEVDMPIFFFVDPLLAEDPRFDGIDHITLTYIFFGSNSQVPEGYASLGFEGAQTAKRSEILPPPLPAQRA